MARPSIVGIHGAPRSGTSWLGQLFNSSPEVVYRYQPFFAYAFRNRVDENSSRGELERFFSELLSTQDDFVLQQGVARLALHGPTFRKSKPTHLVYKEVRFHHLIPHLLDSIPDLKVIGLIRDPRSVISSWFKAPKEFNPSWSESQEWLQAERKNNGLIENWYGFKKWKELATMLLDLAKYRPERCRVVRYEDLINTTKPAVDDLFAFCGIQDSQQTNQFILESTSRDDDDPYSVYRKLRKTNLPVLPDDIEQAIQKDLDGTSLAQFLITSIT